MMLHATVDNTWSGTPYIEAASASNIQMSFPSTGCKCYAGHFSGFVYPLKVSDTAYVLSLPDTIKRKFLALLSTNGVSVTRPVRRL